MKALKVLVVLALTLPAVSHAYNLTKFKCGKDEVKTALSPKTVILNGKTMTRVEMINQPGSSNIPPSAFFRDEDKHIQFQLGMPRDGQTAPFLARWKYEDKMDWNAKPDKQVECSEPEETNEPVTE